MKNKAEYLEYVKSVLERIRKSEAIPVTSYDTGFGLHIVDDNLGDAPMTLFVVQHSLAKVLPPNHMENMDEWDEAWQAGKALVRRFIDRYHGQMEET